ncbi:hypothetical protein [Acinetobacter baumannii]|uniref:hypothetical protein n=1 Tax=Acinetobacter baumannii TaxID=470 RepID=UPI0001F8AE29|nr:hypothetical protein [Acinetobacter baumannii]ADX03024.1 Putative uncharacterized protein precursor [Acinetobacter baumannii 1656-2]AOP63334.1 hypothetical protein DU202_02171 [Acinetobacter baumannii DU202]RQL51986.1 hypothetical protein BJI61_00100 [Acinetobacter baumannii]RSP41902.1 hypothetical protein EA733_06405 [Acinetobacter baumannii]
MATQVVIEVPGVPISELEPTSNVSPNDVMPVVQEGETKKAPLQQVADLVKSGLGTAALKNESDFATPTAVVAVAQSSQSRDDAINERVDEVEFNVTLAKSGYEASFNSYAEMLAYTPSGPNVSVRVNNDVDSSKVGTYTWTGTEYKIGTDLFNLAVEKSEEYTNQQTKPLKYIYLAKQNYPYSISDSAGRMAFAIKDNGAIAIEELEVNAIKTQSCEFNSSAAAFSITDKNKNAAIAIMSNGVVKAGTIEVNELQVGGKEITALIGRVRKVGHYAFNVVHFEIFGQSLSQGAYSSPIQTTVQKYDSVMFVGGIRPQHPSYNVPNFYGSFIPLVEEKDVSGYVGYETPCGGATDCVKQLINDENGIEYTQQKYQLLGTACGEGGMSLASLSTTYLNNNLKPAITNAFNLAQAQGLTYGMPLMGWVQGEEDNKPSIGTTIQQYKDGLQNLIGLIDSHLKTLNSNLALDGLITTQLCSFKTSGRTEPNIELAIYQAATEASSNVYLACPLYIFDYADGYHINGVSSKWMGAYIGLVHKRVLVDGEDWKPVYPISHVKQGRILEVKFHVPVQPLVFDTSHIALNTNYGFSLVDNSNNSIVISSVEITQGDTVKIIAVDPIPVGANLRYAWTPSAQPNRVTGPRGNLRDSQGVDLIFDPDGINKPLHNWCPIFEYLIS